MLAVFATLAASLVFAEAHVPAANAAPGLNTSNLTINLDATNTSSLAASSPTQWTSVSPGSYAGSGTLANGANRAVVGGIPAVQFNGVNQAVGMGTGVGRASGLLKV